MQRPVAVILAGGQGERFWPLSRRARPKQLLRVGGSETLLEATLRRIAPLFGPEDCYVVTQAAQQSAMIEVLSGLVAPDHVLAEPVGRNTAPAVAVALAQLLDDEERTLVVLPADHRIGRPEAFLQAVQEGLQAIAQNPQQTITLGVVPTRPETGYGYIESEGHGMVQRVKRFVEKPAPVTAEMFFRSGRFYWNAGVFIWQSGWLRHLYSRFCPDIAAWLKLPEAARAAAYPGLHSVSLDYGLLEKTRAIKMVPVDCDWDDLGSFGALTRLLPQDAEGNTLDGRVVGFDNHNVTVIGGERVIAVFGVRDLVLVDTPDALLLCPADRVQEVREVVARLRATGSEDVL